MKTLRFMFAVALLAICSNASAQFSNSKSVSSTSTDPWSSFWVEWNPSTFSPNHGDSESFTAFSLGLSRAFSLSPSAPVFLEAGLGAQYSFKSDFMDQDDFNFSMLSAKAPFSLIYKFDIPDTSVSLMPYAGLDLRFNILAKLSYDGESIDMFDKDDMGGSSNTWNRFQIGWHIGLKARLGQSFILGATYGTDFSEIADKVHINTVTVTAGFAF